MRTIDEMTKEYDELIQMQRAGGPVVEALRIKMAAALADTRTVSTSTFQSMASAERYYAVLGFRKEDVERKIQDNEITIDASPKTTGHWNDEDRWVTRDNASLLQMLQEQLTAQEEDGRRRENRLCELAAQILLQERIENITRLHVPVATSKADLRALVQQYGTIPWDAAGLAPLKKHARNDGCVTIVQNWRPEMDRDPFMDSCAIRDLSHEKLNNRIAIFRFQDSTWIVAFLRRFENPRGKELRRRLHGTDIYLIADDKIEHIPSRAALLRLMLPKG